MSTRDFLFALQFSDEAPFDDMLGDVAGCVLGRVGCGREMSREVLERLHEALADGASEGLHQCEVQFRVQGDDLEVAVTFRGGRAWRSTHKI